MFKVNLLLIGREVEMGERRVRGKLVFVRVQRRVRMGKKGQSGFTLYTIPILGHMTIYLYLFGYLYILIGPCCDLYVYLESSRTF